MIPKSEMKPGMWYKGICRNAYTAVWDEKQGCFLHIGYEFGRPYVETIKHFEDVKTLRIDGFIPVEEIPRLEPREIREIKHRESY